MPDSRKGDASNPHSAQLGKSLVERLLLHIWIIFSISIVVGLIIVSTFSIFYLRYREKEAFQSSIELLATGLEKPVEYFDYSDSDAMVSGYFENLPIARVVVLDRYGSTLSSFGNENTTKTPDIQHDIVSDKREKIGTLIVWHDNSSIKITEILPFFVVGILLILLVLGGSTFAIQRLLQHRLRRPLHTIMKLIEMDQLDRPFFPDTSIYESHELAMIVRTYGDIRNKAKYALEQRDDALARERAKNNERNRQVRLIEQTLLLSNMSLGYQNTEMNSYSQLGAKTPKIISKIMRSGNLNKKNIKNIKKASKEEVTLQSHVHHEQQDSPTDMIELIFPSDVYWELRKLQLDNGRIAVFAADVTLRRKTDKILRHKNKMEAMGALSSGVAHDFNNVLAIISTALEHIELLETADKGAVEIALDAVDRGAAIVRRLLQFVNISEQSQSSAKLDKLFDELSRILPPLLGPQVQLDVYNSLASDELEILANYDHTLTVLVNLSINARDAMDGGGRLSIMAREANPKELQAQLLDQTSCYVAIDVTDSGTGISPDIVERIFEPFFSSKKPGKGTGLGLSMAYDFLSKLGGSIALTQTSSEGTCFTVFIPQVKVKFSQPKSQKRTHFLKLKGQSLLIVDDETAFLKAAKTFLKNYGIEAVCCDNITDTYKIAENMQPDILITDFHMPGGTGIDLLHNVLERKSPSICVLMSGNCDFDLSDLRAKADRAGSQLLFMHKPFKLSDLAEKLENILSENKISAL